MGLSEAHQVLVLNGLRHFVRLRADGGMRTGRDIVIAAMLALWKTSPSKSVGRGSRSVPLPPRTPTTCASNFGEPVEKPISSAKPSVSQCKSRLLEPCVRRSVG